MRAGASLGLAACGLSVLMSMAPAAGQSVQELIELDRQLAVQKQGGARQGEAAHRSVDARQQAIGRARAAAA